MVEMVVENNFENYRKSLTLEQRESIDELKQQMIDVLDLPLNEVVHDITDFDSIWKDDDFKDLSFKKEMIIAVATSTLLVISLLGVKYLISR